MLMKNIVLVVKNKRIAQGKKHRNIKNIVKTIMQCSKRNTIVTMQRGDAS